jgi:hypothetical protein
MRAVVSAVEKLKEGRPKGFDVTKHPDYYTQMKDCGYVYPWSVNRLTGWRTKLIIKLTELLPRESLIFLKNNFCWVPDALHAGIRIMEHDIRLHAQYLYSNSLFDNGTRFAQNLTVRDVKAPRFSFTVTGKENKVEMPSFSGRDAAVIMAGHLELIEGGSSAADICPIFQGVLSYGERVLLELDSTNAKVLLELHPTLERPGTDFPDGLGPGISRRTLAELQISSINELMKVLRTDSINVAVYKFWVETYYQATVALFGHEALTAYKLKLDMIWQTLEIGEIQSTKNHLFEGGEKNNHTAQKEFYRGTRDGADDRWSRNSCFQDLQNSSFGICALGMRRDSSESYGDKKLRYETTARIANNPAVESDDVLSYMDVVRKPVSYPQLHINKPGNDEDGKDVHGEFMRGIHFVVVQ